jgi:hypothetical protein
VIRRRKVTRLTIAAVGLVMLLYLGAWLVVAIAHRSPVALVLFLFLAYSAFYFYSDYRVSVEARENDLVVRNRLRKHEFSRDEIAGFRIGPNKWDPVRESVHVVARDGRLVELAVTRRMDSVRRGRADLERFLDDLTAWQTPKGGAHAHAAE